MESTDHSSSANWGQRPSCLKLRGQWNERSPLLKWDDIPTSSRLTVNGDDFSETNKSPNSEVSEPTSFLSQKYESLDYDPCENTVYLDALRKRNSPDNRFRRIITTNLLRWVVVIAIGILTAATAFVIDIVIEELSALKFSLLKGYMTDAVISGMFIKPYGMWIVFNVVPVAIGCALVTYVAPVASGSGIPVIKCYLNGVKVPEVVRVKTFFVKAVGVITSVVGGLACGKEGPMIHCGAAIAAGFSQGKSTTFNKDFKIFTHFREDREKRDFVSAGAAAGVAAAFGAPVGGVLFSLEEGASFWNQALTWKIFFCSTITTFFLNVMLSGYHGQFGQLSYPGLLNFGKFDDINYSLEEFPIWLIIGGIGGLLGALFVHLNYRLSVFRMRYTYRRWVQIVDALLVAAATATVGYLMIFFIRDCKPLINDNEDDAPEEPLQFTCGDGEYNGISRMWYQTAEASVRSLFHDTEGMSDSKYLAIFAIFYFFLFCWTYGLSVSSGLFIPCLLLGAAWGRIIGAVAESIMPNQEWCFAGKFALLGAAAMLGGVVRMTLSLTVILTEGTGNITFGLPLMITLMVAKWVADFFNEGIYDIQIQLAGVPLLGWEPPPLSDHIYASEVMSNPVTTFYCVEKVSRIVDVLMSEPHNGFPVVDAVGVRTPEEHTFGHFRGLILRWQLIVLLQHKIFNETAESEWPNKKLTADDFRDAYPRYPPVERVHISPSERNFTIDLRPFMNPSPYTVAHNASLPRIFRLFRALGLRHLVVLNDQNEVVGIVTRKDLARFRVNYHAGKMDMEQLSISHG